MGKTEITDYEKCFYKVTLKNGEEVVDCWPNAGRFVAMDGTDRTFWKEDIESYRKMTQKESYEHMGLE
jgi:hypothetical protein